MIDELILIGAFRYYLGRTEHTELICKHIISVIDQISPETIVTLGKELKKRTEEDDRCRKNLIKMGQPPHNFMPLGRSDDRVHWDELMKALRLQNKKHKEGL